MDKRLLGNTGIEASVLGFGCGMVGGLMIKGRASEQARAVARARELGINYFDTAPHYGRGESERNLGRALADTGFHDAVIATKTWVEVPGDGPIGPAIEKYILDSIDTSLRLLRRERVDLLQLHNVLGAVRQGNVLDATTVLNDVLPVFQRLQRAGKVGAIGITALGDVAAIEVIVDSGQFATAQVVCNMLNDSVLRAIPKSYPGQDYRQLVPRMHSRGMAALGIRMMAAGALSGTEARHPMGLPTVAPLGSGDSYATDVARARRLQVLVVEGHAGSLVEAAIRFCTGNPSLASTMLGLSSLEQLETAAAAAKRGSLSEPALRRIAEVQSTFAQDGE